MSLFCFELTIPNYTRTNSIIEWLSKTFTKHCSTPVFYHFLMRLWKNPDWMEFHPVWIAFVGAALAVVLGCPRIGRNKKVFQNMSERILSHSLGSWELPKKNSAWSDIVYPSLKAAAFWQNIQRIFEIYKGKIFLWVISIFFT